MGWEASYCYGLCLALVRGSLSEFVFSHTRYSHLTSVCYTTNACYFRWKVKSTSCIRCWKSISMEYSNLCYYWKRKSNYFYPFLLLVYPFLHNGKKILTFEAIPASKVEKCSGQAAHLFTNQPSNQITKKTIDFEASDPRAKNLEFITRYN